ncbi:hypothetical protein HY933_04025 [Candidatus Falkowbacteria bacterium]|nr:hypothetical protein [Candidatus Falkowbacteria bacterium]
MDDWMNRFKQLGALWVHDGEPKRPHALLTAGGHSDGFFNGSRIVEDPTMLCHVVTAFFAAYCREEGTVLPDRVIGSAHGATPLAVELGRMMGCKIGWTEPQSDGSMLLKRFDVRGQCVLVVEDVMTSGATTRSIIEAVQAAGGAVLRLVLVVFNRSRMTALDGRPIISLVHHPLNEWKVQQWGTCPLCAQGSEAVRPKANWAALTADYPQEG